MRFADCGGIVGCDDFVACMAKHIADDYQYHRKQWTVTDIVSRGLGNSVFPFRVGNRPEIVVAQLQKGE